MLDYQYETLCGLGKALYLHSGLIKRADEAKTAMVNIERVMNSKGFKLAKRTVKKVSDAVGQLSGNNITNNKNTTKLHNRVSSLVTY